MLFLLKIVITPLLVAGVSLASRRWGPTVGGVLIGLPWFTGPVLFLLTRDRGEDFGAAACIGIQLGVVCVSAFMVAYGLASKAARWPASLAGAMAAFAASAWAMQHPGLLEWAGSAPLAPLGAAAGAALLSLAVAYVLLPRPATAALPQALPWWDIPMRMAATAVIVAALMLTADALGPRLSGIAATYPVILTVVATFTHHSWGREAAWRVLRGLTTSLFSFVAFFLVVGATLQTVGLVAAYALASMVALVLTAGLIALNRSRVAG